MKTTPQLISRPLKARPSVDSSSTATSPPPFGTARLLIVDDEPINVLLLKATLEDAGYCDLISTTDSRQVAALVESEQPDLILLDLMMPHLSGFEVMEQLNFAHGDNCEKPFLPILVLTADVTNETKQRALRGGAHDFLTKPFDRVEVLLRIHNLLSLRSLHVELHHHNQTLEERVRERTRQVEESHHALEKSQLEMIERLARAAEFRDDDTGQHTQRVGYNCALIAEHLGFSPAQVEVMRCVAPLHDVGKIGIPDEILLKPGKLTPEEFDIMKTHAAIGAELLAGGQSPLVQMAQLIAISHHERWDGNGYPHKIAATNIPLEGRIVAIADVFDALTHARPYKAAWPRVAAIQEIVSQSGKQFDPAVVEAFLKAII